MIKATLTRNYGSFQTPGTFRVYKDDTEVFKCLTLELPYKNNKPEISCIPEGLYTVKKITRPDGRPGLHVQDVPGRTAILIHTGNFAAGDHPDILGCILVGLKYAYINSDGHLDIADSTKAFNALYPALPDEFKLAIL